jgi:hypothetical protein
MKKLLLLLVAVATLMSCDKPKEHQSEKIPLRQLVKSETKESYSSASFFLIAGSAHSGTYTDTDIKAMGSVNGEYRYLKMKIEKVRIKIDNSVKIPYVILKYETFDKVDTDQLLMYDYKVDSYTIVCPEQYLPERLLPIVL